MAGLIIDNVAQKYMKNFSGTKTLAYLATALVMKKKCFKIQCLSQTSYYAALMIQCHSEAYGQLKKPCQ
jgi:hypothetical protein